MEKTADSPEHNAERRDCREEISGYTGVTDRAFRDFDGGVTAEQRADDCFARCEIEPALSIVPVQPAFGENVNNFRSKKGADERREINRAHSAAARRVARPKPQAQQNARDHQPRIRSDLHYLNL